MNPVGHFNQMKNLHITQTKHLGIYAICMHKRDANLRKKSSKFYLPIIVLIHFVNNFVNGNILKSGVTTFFWVTEKGILVTS